MCEAFDRTSSLFPKCLRSDAQVQAVPLGLFRKAHALPWRSLLHLQCPAPGAPSCADGICKVPALRPRRMATIEEMALPPSSSSSLAETGGSYSKFTRLK